MTPSHGRHTRASAAALDGGIHDVIRLPRGSVSWQRPRQRFIRKVDVVDVDRAEALVKVGRTTATAAGGARRSYSVVAAVGLRRRRG